MIKIKITLILLLVQTIFLTNTFGFNVWEKPVLISFNKYNNKYPDIFQENDLTFITWTMYKKNIPYIYFNYKDNKWHTPSLVTKLNKKKIILPSIIYKDGTIYIFVSNDNNIIQLFYKKFHSKNKFNQMTLASNEKFSILPDAYQFNNNIFMFYQKYINNKEFKIKYFTNIEKNLLPASFHTLIHVSGKEHGSFFPVIKFYNNKIFALWVDRFGKGNIRNDVIYIKSSSDNYREWSESTIISDLKKDAQFPDFIIKNDKLYLVYTSSEYKNFQYNTFLITKIFNLNNLALLYSNKINLKFSMFYRLKLRWFKNNFFIFWYSYIKKNSQIFFIQSSNFKNWASPIQITKKNKNKLMKVQSQNNLSLLYEKHIKNKSLIFYREKDCHCKPPILYSTTHKLNKWSYKNSVIFKWKEPYDISGIKGYAYILDNNPTTTPEIQNLSSQFNGKSFENLENGTYYFHLCAIDRAENFSPAVHYKVMINTSPPDSPVIYSKTHQEFIPSNNNSPYFFWHQKDKRPVKGYSYLLTHDENLIPRKKINTQGTNITFKYLKEGIWYFKVRACDTYARWSSYSTYTISIEKILLASKAPMDAESRFSYIVRTGDVLSIIINKILQIKKKLEWRDYEKPVGKFNYLQNLDFLKPGDIVMFPIIIAKPSDTIEKISRDVFGTEYKCEKIIIVGKEKGIELDAGDKIIVKDKFFLKTGKFQKKFK